MPGVEDVGATALPGGTANRGRVIRVGNTVQRPAGAHTEAVHALLSHLERRGFDGAPRVLGRDETTESLRYIEGEAATEPLAEWALSDAALAGVGSLLRAYHDHAAGFDATAWTWQRPLPQRWRGTLVTHNDVNPANVIFHGKDPVALIDFDLAAPGCVAWDLAVTACFWAPLRDGADIEDSRRERVLHRFRLLLDSYRADAGQRNDAALAAGEANRWIADVIEDAAEHGHPAFGTLWQRAMGMHRRASAWLATHKDELLSASR
jgi:hypothetical protein